MKLLVKVGTVYKDSVWDRGSTSFEVDETYEDECNSLAEAKEMLLTEYRGIYSIRMRNDYVEAKVY